MRGVESLSRRQREITPLPFCSYLLSLMEAMYGDSTVAVLWICRRSNWIHFWPRVEPWGEYRNALLYAGPCPIIAHPPCGPWGQYRSYCHQSPTHGIRAMEMVHRWGGIVEQPSGSRLFREHGRGGTILRVNQGDYGHPARKATHLYVIAPHQRPTPDRT
jgi:hypothetical protein